MYAGDGLHHSAPQEARPQLQFPCRLPCDIRGVPSGPEYKPFLIAGRDNRHGTGWNPVGLKAGRRMQCLSTLERTAVYRYELDSTVLDIREQYPMYNSERIADLLADPQRRIRRNEVATLDLVLTRLDPIAPLGYSHQAVSIKHVADLGRADVQRRFEREQAFCHQLGWRWTLLTEREVSRIQATAARTVCRLATDLDLESLRQHAQDLARLMLRQPVGATLRAALAALARKTGTKADRVLQLIAVAILYGYLHLDPNQPFERGSPLIVSEGASPP